MKPNAVVDQGEEAAPEQDCVRSGHLAVAAMGERTAGRQDFSRLVRCESPTVNERSPAVNRLLIR